MDIPFVKSDKDGLKIYVKLTPNAAHTEFCGIFTDADNTVYLKIAVKSVPEDGKANQELCAFIAKFLHISKSSVLLLSGFSGRRKIVLVKNADETIKEKLCRILS